MIHLLFLRLAFQNMQRRPARTLLLILAVALGSASVFSSITIAEGVVNSTERSFARMGADLIIVPAQAMVNITTALLTVQPTDETIDRGLMAQVAAIDGIANVTPQSIHRMSIMAGMPGHRASIIAFDPETDFTVLPWINQRLQRPMRTGDVVSGGRRDEEPGQEIQLCNVPAPVYAKLGRSGVGPFDESLFATYDSVERFARNDSTGRFHSPKFDRRRVSAILVRLKPGVPYEQARFALSRLPGVRIVPGPTIAGATRQTVTILMWGMLGFGALMLGGSLLLVGLLFSAIVRERRREAGVLKAIGAQRSDICRTLVAEAAFIASFGGVVGLCLGGALLFAFQNTLVYYLQTVHVEFVWPSNGEMMAVAGACLMATALIGIVAAALPAWKASGEEPLTLILREEANC